jgi:hypothetical protein
LSRKYRHQGYQDADHEDRRSSQPKPPPSDQLTPEERIQRRSLRRATTREANEVVRCHNCGSNMQGSIVHDSRCPSCSVALHCCRACVHFDTAARWQCRAEIQAAISAKNEANLCPRYQPRLVLDATGRRASTPQSSSQDPKAQFENLFKR